MNQQTNQTLQKALSFMGFEDIPSMKDLTMKYKKMCLQLHPDKNLDAPNAKERFQELQQCYKVVGDQILENINDNINNVTDKDEEHFINMFQVFKNFNFDKRNTNCHTVLVENKNAALWRQVLTTNLSLHKESNSKEHIFKHHNWRQNKTVTVTLYDTPATDNQSKVHVQSGDQFVNDDYILDQMPLFYMEVRKLNMDSMGLEGTSVSRGRATRSTSKKNDEEVKKRETVKQKTTPNYPVPKNNKSKCDVCGYKNKNSKQFNDHMKHEHDDRFDKLRKLTDLESSDEEMELSEKQSEEENIVASVTKQTQEDKSEEEAAVDQNVNDEVIEVEVIKPAEEVVEAEAETEVQKLATELDRLKEENKRLIEKNKKLEKENKEKKALAKEKEDTNAAYVMKLTEVQDENSKLLTKIQFYQDIVVTNDGLNEKYEKMREENADMKAKIDELEKEESDDVDIRDIVRNKFSGSRRQGGSGPQPAPDLPPEIADIVLGESEFKCTGCDFVSKDSNMLKIHISKVHKQCEMCPEHFPSVLSLRDHIRLKHNKKNGTYKKCDECDFSSVNRAHLQAHIRGHHREERSHTKMNKVNKTCKYWRDSACNFGKDCRFKHEIIVCIFGQNCRDIQNCRFEHEKPGPARTVRKDFNSWPNLTVSPTINANRSLFLGQGQQQQQQQPQQKHQTCQCPGCPSMNRGRGL